MHTNILHFYENLTHMNKYCAQYDKMLKIIVNCELTSFLLFSFSTKTVHMILPDWILPDFDKAEE